MCLNYGKLGNLCGLGVNKYNIKDVAKNNKQLSCSLKKARWLTEAVKKIAIIMYDYLIGNLLSFMRCAASFAKEGYDVHIFIDSSIYQRARASFGEDNISVHPIEIQADARADGTTNKAVSNRWNAFIANMAAKSRDKRSSGRSSVLLDTCQALHRNLRALGSKRNDAWDRSLIFFTSERFRLHL